MGRYVRWMLPFALVIGACATTEPPGAPRATVGFVLVGESDDLGYNQAVHEASEALAKAFPDLRVVRRGSVPEDERAEAVMESMVAQGATVIFATSFGYLPYAVRVAERHPDVIVLHQGGVEPDPGLPNLGTYWGEVFQPVFLAGVVAGRATRTGRLGFVAAFPIPATFANVNAFTLGARSVRPDARTFVRFTGDWCDPERQRAEARALLARRVDVMTQHQDCTRTVLRVAERAGISSVGYHYDGSEVAPRGWLTGAVWNWTPVFIDAMNAILAGSFATSPFSGDYRGAQGQEPFVLTEPGPSVSRATARLIEALRAELEAGRPVFAGPLRDRDGQIRVAARSSLSLREIERMDYFVEGVVGEIPG